MDTELGEGKVARCPNCRQAITRSLNQLRPNYALVQSLAASSDDVDELLRRWGLRDATHLIIPPGSLTLDSVLKDRGLEGQIWKGTYQGGEVAVKAMQLPGAMSVNDGDGTIMADAPALASLKRELVVLLHITQECQFVARYLGITRKGDKFCIVMALYPGSLSEFMGASSGRLPLAQAIAFAKDIAKGMEELHEHGVAMLDLKPDNVLVTKQGTAVLTDFGVSRVITNALGVTRQTNAMGTYNYMSPEQMDRKSKIGVKADAWGFACTVLQMVTGVMPWAGLDVMEIMYQVAVEKNVPETPAGLPPSLARCIAQCFKRDPNDRPTAREISKALKAAVTEQAAAEASSGVSGYSTGMAVAGAVGAAAGVGALGAGVASAVRRQSSSGGSKAAAGGLTPDNGSSHSMAYGNRSLSKARGGSGSAVCSRQASMSHQMHEQYTAMPMMGSNSAAAPQLPPSRSRTKTSELEPLMIRAASYTSQKSQLLGSRQASQRSRGVGPPGSVMHSQAVTYRSGVTGANVSQTTGITSMAWAPAGPLITACRAGALDEVKHLLVTMEGDAMEQDADGATALHWAVLCGHREIAAMLLGRVMRPTNAAAKNGPNDDARTVHTEAAYSQCLEGTGLESGAPSVMDSYRRQSVGAPSVGGVPSIAGTQRSMASRTGSFMTAITRTFTRGRSSERAAKTEIDTEDKDSATALHWAALGGSKACVDLLLVRGSHPSVGDKIGATPLHWAVLGNSLDVMQGRPMTEYESEHAMFLMLQKLKILPKGAVSDGHWCQWSGWPMLTALAGCVTKEEFAWLHAANFFSLSCDEATTNDKSQFLSVTAYIVQNFARVPVFLALKDIKGAGAEDLQKLIMEALLTDVGLTTDNVACKLVSFACDGANVMQGDHASLAKRVHDDAAPFLSKVWCSAHRASLVAKAQGDNPVVFLPEQLVGLIYTHFSVSGKSIGKFEDIAKVCGTKGNAALRAPETRWLSLLKPMLRVQEEYRSYVEYFYQSAEAADCAEAIGIFDKMVDLNSLLGLWMLEELLAAGEGSMLEWEERADGERVLCLRTSKDGDEEMYELVSIPPATGQRGRPSRRGVPTTEEQLGVLLSRLKSQVVAMIKSVLSELERRFPIDAVLNALAVVYPHFWWRHEAAICAARESGGELAARKAEATMRAEFESRLDVIDKHFGQPKQLSGAEVLRLIDATQLRQEGEGAVADHMGVGFITRLWRELTSHTGFSCPTFELLAELAIVMVPVSVEDERLFSALNFIKSKSRNRLQNPHLSDALRLFFSNTFDVLTFPYAEALQAGKEAVDRGRYNKMFT
ncbi:hypothetical protein FOA52_002324 [Chlamydomonas sp. UWO 241]|nr:hypothetical protein FOA52_002324 [Chlamydomonas sp. UWO 241]